VDFLHTTSAGDLGVLALGLVIAGVVSGLLAGVLGLGGGIVLVPVLYHVMTTLGVDAGVRMHVAVGTALAGVIPASVASLRARNKEDAIDWTRAQGWGVPMLAGVVAGSALCGIVGERTLALLFAIAALSLALLLALVNGERQIWHRLPGGFGGLALPAIFGTAATLTGIGGGTLEVPATISCGVPIARATATASVFAAIVAIPGALGALIAGWHAPGLPPYSLGYVNLLGVLLIAPASLVTVPLGTSIAQLTDVKRLRLVFAALIAITTARMLWDAL
jgi:uncharacterized membrane protein YfcA